MFENLLKCKDAINQNSLFWFCALLGSGMVIIQFLLSLIGGIDHEDCSSSETDFVNVKWMSKQAVAGFLMLFGWSALACQNQFHLPSIAILPIAVAAGVIAVLVNGFIFSMARKLHSSGSVFRLEDTVGKEGIVYQEIPRGGMGKISISVHDMTHEVDAVSEHGEELSSFTAVRVVKTNDNGVVVTQINSF